MQTAALQGTYTLNVKTAQTALRTAARVRHDIGLKRQKLPKLLAKIREAFVKKDCVYALNSYRYLMESFEGSLFPEEKAQFYEEMGRLCLALKRHANEACQYFRLSVFALGVLEDKKGIISFLERYDSAFQGPSRQPWERVLEDARAILCGLIT